MPSQPPIPPLLSTHLHYTPPRGFLSLVTSVLGASANWIVLRHIFAALQHPSGDQGQDTAVIVVSWLRGSDFWRDGAKKLVGQNFHITRLCIRSSLAGSFLIVVLNLLHMVYSIVTLCFFAHLLGVQGLNVSQNGSITFIDALQSGLGLQSDGIGEVECSLLKAIDEAKATSSRILLVLDGIDFLLAASEAGVDAVLDTIWELQEHVHATIVSASADFPLIQAQNTPLELNHASLVTSVAHQAKVLWSVRELDTGSARDVSGVLRITRGPAMEFEADGNSSKEGVEEDEKELLYFIAGDSGVRVFERGSS
ncbi:MAG: hypothetical protein Q9182_000725 [Xanthomendoza sp. 2 TL-2023]